MKFERLAPALALAFMLPACTGGNAQALQAQELAARGEEACSGLTFKEKERAFRRTTGLQGVFGLNARLAELERLERENPTRQTRVAIRRLKAKQYIGCLEERGDHGDNQTAQRIRLQSLDALP